jgi:hypothetical protein
MRVCESLGELVANKMAKEPVEKVYGNSDSPMQIVLQNVVVSKSTNFLHKNASEFSSKDGEMRVSSPIIRLQSDSDLE